MLKIKLDYTWYVQVIAQSRIQYDNYFRVSLILQYIFSQKPITFKKQEKYLHIARTKLSWDN